MPPAIIVGVAAAAGAWAVGATLATIALVGVMAMTVTTALTTKTASAPSYRSTSERKQVLRSSAAPEVLAYGTTISSGVLFFAEEQGGSDNGDGEWLHLAIALCGHEIDGVETILIGDDDISMFPATNVTWEIHSNRTTPDPFMLQNCPSWKDDMIGFGMTWLRISLKFDQELFPSGLPNIKVKKRNKKVYDPRDGQIKFTNNAALVYLDYFRSVMQVPDTELNMAEFIEAANISDEQVGNGDGSVTSRYTIDGEIDMDEARVDVITDMLMACGGESTYRGGQHGLMVAAYYGPATMTLDQSAIVGSIKIVPETSYKERVNTITGTYISMAQGFTEVDFPSVVIDTWLQEDGETFSQDFKYRFVTNPYTAQRLASITVKRKRQGRTIEVPVNLSGYQYRPGLNLMLNINALGISGVEFKVTKWTFGLKDSVNVTLRQDNANMYGDAIGQVVENPDLTQLPIGGVAQPFNLQYTVEEIGQVVQGILTWENTGPYAYNQVVIRDSANNMVMSAQVPGNLLRITGLVRGVYTAHVVAIGVNGAKSPEGYLEFNIAAPDAPNTVVVSFGYFQATLTPRLAQIQNVSTQFDFWTSGETALANSNTETVESNASRVYMGTQYTTQSDLKVDHTYHYYVRTINAFGSSAFYHVQFQYTFATGDLIDFINSGIQKTEAYANLTRSAEDNYQAILENALANNSDVERSYREFDAVNVKLTASYTEITNLMATDRLAYAQRFTQLQASVDITSDGLDVTNNNLSNTNNNLNNLGQNVVRISATVQETSSAYADLTGKLSAQWGIKLQLNTATGNRYIAGVQLGLEANGGTVQSLFAVRSDVFAVYNPSNNTENLAFAIKNGQVFLSEGIFDYTSITLAKLGSWYSANYVAGSTGTIMRSDGSFELNGINDSSGRVFLNNQGLTVMDGSGVTRVKVGRI